MNRLSDSEAFGSVTCAVCNHAACLLSPDWNFVTGPYEGRVFTVALCRHCHRKATDAATGSIMSTIRQHMRLSRAA